MKKYIYALLVILSFLSCKKETEAENQSFKKKEVIRYGFGFKLNDFTVIQDSIRKNDTFGSLIQNQNLNGKQVFDVVAQIKDTFNVKMMRLHKPYMMLLSKDKTKQLRYFVYQPDQRSYYIVDFNDSIAKATKKILPITIKRRTVAGELNGSLSETLKNEGVAASLSSKLTNVYKWSIDFFKSKKGDKFAVTFTERYINDTIYDGVDSLECAFFEYKGKRIYAFPFQQNKGGKIEYYDEEGKALKNFFLKAPLKSINITSRFSKRRFHPVQKFFKAHNGTDYAAPHGTPIMSTANGVVELAGYTAGNGNHVKIKHDRTYSTQYLHMSRILVRRGQRVAQGQIIGKVGSTGLATGPHVCYRFWKNGKQVDALRLKLPNSTPMDAKNKPQYLESIKPLKRELDSIAGVK